MMTMTTTAIRHLIGGRDYGTPVVERANPARRGDIVAITPAGDATTVEAAVDAAARAQPDWARATGPQRGQVLTDAAVILEARQEDVSRDLTREEGKTIAEATAEVARAVATLRFFGAEGWRIAGDVFPSSVPDTLVYTRKEPLGVVGIITPWNFPIAIPTWKTAPALIAGNAVVLKPAQQTPVSAWHLARALADAGLPDGILNVVYGAGSTVGTALVDHPDVPAISFTGSTHVGHDIHNRVATRMGRSQLEMGGKNALVVLDDADVSRAAAIAASGGFGLTGQACTATSRAICTPGIHDDFVEALVAEAKRYRAADGLDTTTLMGPVVSGDQLATDQRYIDLAATQGGRVLTGGASPEGLYLDPVVIDNVDPSHRIAQEEVFGPVIGVIQASDLDEAITITNGVPYGLSAGLVTTRMASAYCFAQSVQAGVIKVNRPTSGVDLNVPFGGTKESSSNTFREQGAAAVDFYTWIKSVYLGMD